MVAERPTYLHQVTREGRARIPLTPQGTALGAFPTAAIVGSTLMATHPEKVRAFRAQVQAVFTQAQHSQK